MSGAVGKERILSALNDYLNLGLPIIPVCSHDHAGYSERHMARCNQAGKIPLIKGWQTHEQTTKAQVQSWLREFKNINIGLPLGHASGYVGIDVDGDLGEDMLEEMSNGELPETWEYVTGAGRRLLYEIPVGMQTKKYVNTGEGDHQECSILANGQQTVLPPSIHHTGRTYEWVEGRSPEDIDCALAPDWLITLVRADETRNYASGTIDLTKEGAPQVKTKEVHPIAVSDSLLPSEFMEYEDIPQDTIAPDDSYVGKKGKAQKQEEESGVSPEELTMRVSAGGRDNHMTRIIGSFCAKNRHLGKEYVMMMAQNHNQMFMDPPLDKLAIEAKVNHFWETEEMKSAKYKKAAMDGEKVAFEPMRIAQVALNLLEEEGYVLKAEEDTQQIWITKKSEGPWRPINASGHAEGLQQFLIKPIAEPELGGLPRWATRKSFGEVANALVLMLRMNGNVWTANQQDIDTQSSDQYKYIPLAGGKLLEWRTGELKPWDPETLLTYVLPVEYDPDAKCPEWERRLAEWLPDEGSRKIMQEFIGYSLIPYMGFEKALLIQGEGANGKSLFLETIQAILGYKVVSAIGLNQLFRQFGKKDIIGKTLNIVNEAGADYLKEGNADEFKNMVSGGRVIADVKGKDPITFNNTAKFIFSANHDIKTSDKSAAWLRRMLIVPFDQDFTKSTESKNDILRPIKKEYTGIFNWAVKGLQRLMEQRDFTVSQKVEDTRRAYTNRNDIAADFTSHCIVKSPEFSVDGDVIERGTATSAIAELFKLWTKYRNSELKKHSERIKEHLEKKGFYPMRKEKKNLEMTSAAKTTCWVHLKVHITDPEFLEYLVDGDGALETGNHYIKDYASKRLAEINEEPTKASVSEIPSTPVSNQ